MSKPNYLHQLGQVIHTVDCFVVSQGHLLMHKRADDKKHFPGFWSIPGGHLDEKEDALACASREIKEETGLRVLSDQAKLRAHAIHHHIDREIVFNILLFRFDIPKIVNSVHTDEGENHWIAFENLDGLDPVLAPVAHYFNHVLHGQGILFTYSTWKSAQLVKLVSESVVE